MPMNFASILNWLFDFPQAPVILQKDIIGCSHSVWATPSRIKSSGTRVGFYPKPGADVYRINEPKRNWVFS